MTEADVAPLEKVGLEETTESFNGYDEIAITQSFGTRLEDMGALMSMRAAVFIVLRRSGLRDIDAYKRVMETSMKGVQDHFTDFDDDDPGDVMADEPVSPVGKDDAPPAPPPMSSRPSS
jgi:hypothetical protein